MRSSSLRLVYVEFVDSVFICVVLFERSPADDGFVDIVAKRVDQAFADENIGRCYGLVWRYRNSKNHPIAENILCFVIVGA